jgi:N-methylhydantoinase B
MAKYSKAVILQCMEELILYSERLMRQQIQQLPDGQYHGEALIDDDGMIDEPIRIAVTLRISGTQIIADYAGTSVQRRAPINATLSSTRSATYYFFAGLLGSAIPTNYGLYKPITVIALEGTVVNASPPAPVVGRMTIYHRIVDALLVALSEAIPERTMASSYGMSNVIAIGGMDEMRGRPWVFFECPTGGWGGARGWMGSSACQPMFTTS